MYSALIPLAASVLGPVVGKLMGGDGVKRGGRGMAMMGGDITRMAGGKRCRGRGRRGRKVSLYRRRRGMNGRGLADIFKKVYKYGKLAFKIARSKKVRGLAKHGYNTYKDVKNEIKAAREKPEEGEGLKMRRGMQRRWAKRIRVRKGNGVNDPVSGPLP